MRDSANRSRFMSLTEVVGKSEAGINAHGCNQYYFEGEDICGNCLAPYTNKGVAPLGAGMHCGSCQNEDIRESMHDMW